MIRKYVFPILIGIGAGFFIGLFSVWLASLSYAAQPITIPVGTTSFGPVAVNGKTQKYSTFSIDRSLWLDPAVKLSVVIDWTPDGKVWAPFCAFTAQGNPKGTPPTSASCPFPSTATQLRGTAVVTGGSITVKVLPQLGAKP